MPNEIHATEQKKSGDDSKGSKDTRNGACILKECVVL